ncbi:murein L,D-transpeptidase [Methyloligella halotolerans]|uniref:Murein L,D-transpeptidase n=1 Tax=Methyloligella halotolerans TaxID=1177755 RepID=A0A1E2RYS2_9HYPH|nr:L,D-transpeptidase family protein [Methyloligella halotolerans]ODA67361.1 murein L,D-transpeptidase [Methyloligella halotolerans]
MFSAHFPTGAFPRRLLSFAWPATLIASFALSASGAMAPAAANPFSSFSDSGPMTAKDRERLREEREAMATRFAPAYEMKVPFVSEAAIQSLQQAITRYRAIVASGGWPKISQEKTLRPGDTDRNVLTLRKHLAIEGDIPRDSRSPKFDQKLVEGLARFQIRNGLKVTGFVDRRTARVLNVPAEERLRQLETNLERVQELMKLNKAKRYVLVNVPGYTLNAVEDGGLALSSRVIVGRPDRATPLIDTRIVEVNFYPTWRVPDSVARKDLIPTIRKDPAYFNRENFNVMPGWGREPLDPAQVNWSAADVTKYKFRQDPGPNNALGIVRLNMPNKHAVYMHDTPLKDLFGQSTRAFSSGCVRVQRVIDLVAWLVSAQKGWDAARVHEAAQAGESIDVRLRPAVPVHFVYLTAWAQGNGAVQFRPDIYGRDSGFAEGEVDDNAAIAAQRSAITP